MLALNNKFFYESQNADSNELSCGKLNKDKKYEHAVFKKIKEISN